MNFETAHAEPSQRAPSAPSKVPPSNPHPEAKRALPVESEAPPGRSLWWLWLVVIIALAIGGWFMYSHMFAGKSVAGAPGTGGASAIAGRPVPVMAEAARRGDMPIYLNGLGSVTPLNTVAVHSRVDGQLVKVAYSEGEIVHHDDTFTDAKMADLEHGDQDKSDLLVQVDPRPFEVQLEQAKGQLARDEALLANAKLDLTRFTLLYAQNSATDQQVQTQKSLVAQDEGTIEIDKSAIHNAELQLVYCNIRTPITGRVGLRLVDVGNIVHATDATPISVVTQLQPITVIFTLPEDNIPQIATKAPSGAGLSVEAWDRDFKIKLGDGKLQAIDNQVDTGSGTIRLRAQFVNEKSLLFPNQFVNARLLVDTLKNVVIIPTAAVQRSPSATFVYVVKADQTVEMRNVVVGQTEGNDTQIQSGLNPGELVVTDGVDKLVAGAMVTPRSASGKGGKGGKAATQPSATQPADVGVEPNTTAPDAAGAHHKGHRGGAGGAAMPSTAPSEGTTPPTQPKS